MFPVDWSLRRKWERNLKTDIFLNNLIKKNNVQVQKVQWNQEGKKIKGIVYLDTSLIKMKNEMNILKKRQRKYENKNPKIKIYSKDSNSD